MTERYDLDALDFDAVRQLLLARLLTPLGRTAVAALAPAADAAAANARLQASVALAERARRNELPPFAGVVEVRSWLGEVGAGEALAKLGETFAG